MADLLTATNVRLAYGYQTLLDGVTLTIGEGEKVGMVGRNGCGKSSLLRILAGDVQPDAGEITRRRGLRSGILPQEFEQAWTGTIEETIRSGAAWLVSALERYEQGLGSEADLARLQEEIEHAEGWSLDVRIRSLAGALGLGDLEQPVGELSGGEKRRVAICRALVGQPDLLLLDEPTNHLDAETIEWLEEMIANFRGAVVFVTHDRYFLDRIATRVVEVDRGRVFSHEGNYTAYLESKAVRREIEEQSERRRQRFLRSEWEWVRAGVRAQRSKSRQRLEQFYEVAGLEAPPEEREMDLLLPPPPELGNTVVELRAVGAKVSEGKGERWLFRGLDISLRSGECVGVVGRNGSGKSTLLKICLGERSPDEGEVEIGTRVRVNVIDQERERLEGKGSLLDEVAEGKEQVVFGDRTIGARGYLRRFLFSDQRINERVDLLSGGERARLLLAKMLRHGGNLLVLDEPTNDLDLSSLRMLEDALAAFTGTVLVVSHDRYFLDRICDRILAIEEGAVDIQPGNYSYYLEKRRARRGVAAGSEILSVSAGKQTLKRDEGGRVRKLTYAEQRELEGMEDQILRVEQMLAEMETRLNDPTYFVSSPHEASREVARLEEAKREVDRLYTRWAELETIQQGAVE